MTSQPAAPPTFDSVLVANRGEIALRVIRGARAAGYRTVAVYSDPDRDAAHVRAADTAVRLGPAPAVDSYLSIPALLDAARLSGAQAVHPGYGFLSERAAFARACTDADLVFIGPSADVIDLMGRKDSSRQVAIGAGVPVVPAIDDATGADLVTRSLDEVGLPLLVKAAAGGGGKGMRIVRTAAELPEAIAAAKREAASAFGDDTVLIERYVEHGRHVEVQIIADAHGTVLHLLERDCSTQRRHQKVLEEAPAPTISEAVRDRLTTAAVDLARASGYTNAGTVEFLVEDENVYLLEMNTRLQVEHPVTELVTGLDLVALQLLVAQGLPLPLTQDQVTLTGHAIEARVYAEDPDHGFLPQAGRTTAVRWPRAARVDAALQTGQTVGTWYDPMLGKIIVHGPDRETARRRLVDALDDTTVFGLTTNVAFLRRVVASDAFTDCEIDTAWLDRNPDALPPDDALDDVLWCAAAWAATHAPGDPADPFGTVDGWRVAAAPAPALTALERGADRRLLAVDRTTGAITLADRTVEVRVVASPASADGLVDLQLELAGRVHHVTSLRGPEGVTVGSRGIVAVFRHPDIGRSDDAGDSDGRITAPMPGTVTDVRVTAGQPVGSGDVLVVMEAMKMEHALTAPADGTVIDVGVAKGDQVSLGQLLVAVDAADTANEPKE